MANVKPISITDAADIPAWFDYFEDLSGQADIDTITQVPDEQWQLIENGTTTFGFKTTAYWLRFSLQNQTMQGLDLIAGLNYSQLDDVIFYVFDNEGLIHEFATGDTRPFYPREVDHPSMLLQLNLAPEQLKTVYVRVQTNGSMILPLQIARSHHYFESVAKEHKLHFFYYGSLTVIILINLAVFLTLREKLYLYYSLAISGYLLFFASILGYSFQHFYPAYPLIHSRALLVSMPVLAFFSVLFCREFLQTREQSPKLDLALRAMMYFEVFNFISAMFFSYNTAILLSAISALFFFSVLFVAGPIRWAAGMRAGIFFTIAWAPLTIGVLATTGRSLGFLPVNFWTQYAMQIGSGLEAFILTLALADRLYREREEKILAQADSLRTEKARHEAHSKLAEAMTHDPVTGLPNRNRFERMVNQQLQDNPDGYYMVGVARVTRLDEINRTLGLSRSERLLKGIAHQMTLLSARLPSVISVKDDKGRAESVYQLSGDSFGVLIDPKKQMDKLKEVAGALRLLTEPLMIDNLAIELHPKFGAASYPMHGDNAALLIRNAHVGMEITPHGKQEVGFYSPDYDIYSESRLTLMSDLKEALQKNQTELYYQPKACLQTGNIIGLEALIRWHHPERGWVYPNDFIPLAEETGVITQLTRWAFEQGIKDLAELSQLYPALSVSINISARDLSAGELNGMIDSILKRYAVSAEQLILELTETAAMEDPEQGLLVLKKLSDRGLSISIDDFGSGYSSLSYLKKLPATEIKLDRSLVMDVCTDESSRMIVETAINMAHGLGYTLVAEGVETEASARLLKQMGCDRLQGFWLCHPLPLSKLKPWLAEQQGKPIL
jgi:EAL domain-containing protein (putative c-di-GMP-specific phosphodiesterase class I)/GGDEF domain-containing protein